MPFAACLNLQNLCRTPKRRWMAATCRAFAAFANLLPAAEPAEV